MTHFSKLKLVLPCCHIEIRIYGIVYLSSWQKVWLCICYLKILDEAIMIIMIVMMLNDDENKDE